MAGERVEPGDNDHTQATRAAAADLTFADKFFHVSSGGLHRDRPQCSHERGKACFPVDNREAPAAKELADPPAINFAIKLDLHSGASI
jgi:hypothetical protein